MKIVYTSIDVDAILATIWRATKLHHNLQIVCHSKDIIGHIISDSHFDGIWNFNFYMVSIQEQVVPFCS